MGIVTVLIVFLVTVDRKASRRNGESHAPEKSVVVGFDPALVDFGTVPQAHLVEHTFRLVNRGTNDVSITLVKASCECTVLATNFVGRYVRAADELLVPVTFDSGQREGKTESSILFVLDFPGGRYKTEAILRGRVQPEFFVEPPALDFGMLYPGESATQTMLLRPERLPGPPVCQTQLNFGAFHVIVRHEIDALKKKTNAAITVAFSAPLLSQQEIFTSPLRLETLSQRVPKVEIALKAQVVPEVEITPNPLVLGPNDTSGESRFTVRSRQPSRVVRALSKSAGGTKIAHVNRSDEEDSDWDHTHHFLVLNSALAGATQIDVELEIRRGAGETEARSASAQIRSLMENTNDK